MGIMLLEHKIINYLFIFYQIYGRRTGQIHRIVAYVSDVSDRKQQFQVLEELQEKQESLIRMLVHDLKSPLHNMIMLAGLNRKEFQKGAATQGYSMPTMLEEAGKNASKLVENLLELLELLDSHFSLDVEKVDLDVLIENMVQYYLPLAAVYHTHLDLQLPEKPVYLSLDA